MSTIYWAKGRNGDWTSAGSWKGGVVPGADDTAVIAAGHGAYTVHIGSPVIVGAVDLDQANAKLYLTSSLTTGEIALQAGTLDLQSGTLSGTVVETAGVLDIGPNSNNIFNDVTWQGTLDPIYLPPIGRHKQPGALTISNGLVLTGAGGTGPGSATFNGAVTFNNISTLDNAVITAGELSITNSPTLTLGAGLTFNVGGIDLSSAVVNDGTVDIGNLTGGTFVNNGFATFGSLGGGNFTNNGTLTAGTINELGLINNGTVDATSTVTNLTLGSFTNDGTIVVDDGQALLLALSDLPTVGAAGVLQLNGGALIVDGEGAAGTLTTAQLFTLYSTQHVAESGVYGFGVGNYDTLINTGATLDIGTGSTLGSLSSLSVFGTITGGTIVNYGTGPVYAGTLTDFENFTWNSTCYNFSSLTLQSTTPMLTLGQVNLQDVLVSGASALDVGGELYGGGLGQLLDNISGGTLSGVGTLIVSNPYPLSSQVSAGVNLIGVDITGVDNSGKVAVLVSNDATLNVSQQAVNGYSFTLDGGTLGFNNIDGNVFNVIGSGEVSSLESGGSLGPGATVSVAAGAELQQVPVPYSFTNEGKITVSAGGTYYIDNVTSTYVNMGTIIVNEGVLAVDPAYPNLQNSGTMSVRDGTLLLIGEFSVSNLNPVNDPGSHVAIGGELDLEGESVVLGAGGVPRFTFDGGEVSNGSITIGAAQSYTWTGGIAINATITNNGNIEVTGSVGALNNYNPSNINGAISGDGTIALIGSGGAGDTLTLGSTVASGQVLAFDSPADTLQFSTVAADNGFSGTLSGFAVGDSLVLEQVYIDSAVFSGNSILIALDGGGTVSLATSSALTGSLALTWPQGSLFETLTYVSTAASVSDWSASNFVRDLRNPSLAGGLREADGGLVSTDHSPLDWFLPLHQM